MKCKICHTEFEPNSKQRVTCSEKCKLENKAINKRWSSYQGIALDTQNSSVRLKNTFLLRA